MNTWQALSFLFGLFFGYWAGLKLYDWWDRRTMARRYQEIKALMGQLGDSSHWAFRDDVAKQEVK